MCSSDLDIMKFSCTLHLGFHAAENSDQRQSPNIKSDVNSITTSSISAAAPTINAAAATITTATTTATTTTFTTFTTIILQTIPPRKGEILLPDILRPFSHYFINTTTTATIVTTIDNTTHTPPLPHIMDASLVACRPCYFFFAHSLSVSAPCEANQRNLQTLEYLFISIFSPRLSPLFNQVQEQLSTATRQKNALADELLAARQEVEAKTAAAAKLTAEKENLMKEKGNLIVQLTAAERDNRQQAELISGMYF